MAKITLELFDKFTLRELSREHICMMTSNTEALLFEKTENGMWSLNYVVPPIQEKFVLTSSVPKEIEVAVLAARMAILNYKSPRNTNTPAT
jgi:hypothetical protein